MLGEQFYFSLIRKYIVLVGSLFNDISITRSDKDGNDTVLIKVPVTYSPKDKMLTRILQDPNLDRPSAVPTLPLIAFEMGQLKYDGSRKLPSTNKSIVKVDSNNFRTQYVPVPYNFQFKVSIYVKNTEDGTKIIEQILPFFTPDWTTTVKLIPEMEVIMDIPIILNDIQYEDNYDGDFTERRSIIWTLDLTLKGYLYGPVKKSGVIKFVNVNFHIPSSEGMSLDTPIIEKLTIQPGLTSNNTPTSNSSISIPYTEIEVSDDFGYIINIENTDQLL